MSGIVNKAAMNFTGEALCGVCAGSGVPGHVVTWCLAFGNHEGCSPSKPLSTLAAVSVVSGRPQGVGGEVSL